MTMRIKESCRASFIVANLVAVLWMLVPVEAAFANLESHDAQDAISSGTTSSHSVSGAPVQFSWNAPPSAVDGGAEWSSCPSTDEGDYMIGGVGAGKYGGGYWHAESDRTGVETYNPYGEYRGVMGVLSWKDHPTEKDAAALFVGGNVMVGEVLRNITMPGTFPPLLPVDLGLRSGIEIEFPGLGEVGELYRNKLYEIRTTPEYAREVGLSDPENVDLGKLEIPDVKLSGAFLIERKGSIGNQGGTVGVSEGTYKSGEISLKCMAEEYDQWLTSQFNEHVVPLSAEFYQWRNSVLYGDVVPGIAEAASRAENAMGDIQRRASAAVDVIRDNFLSGIEEPSPLWGL